MAQRWRDWLAQAEHDLEQATASRNDGRHDWACFAAHQAAEKAVKALHLSMGQEAWGHVVARLLSELPDPPPQRLVEQGRSLDNYYIPTRCPNLHPEGAAYEHYGPLQSDQGLIYAGDILRFVGAITHPDPHVSSRHDDYPVPGDPHGTR